MRKISLLTLFLAVCATMVALTLGKVGPSVSLLPSSPEVAAAAAQEDTKTFYGYITYCADWQPDDGVWNPQYGLYSIPAEGDKTRVWANDGAVITDGAFYLNGQIHYLNTAVIKSFLGTYSSNYVVIDADSYAQASSVHSENAKAYGTDITYDYISGNGYAVACVTYNSTNPTKDYHLSRFDISTGAFTVISYLGVRMYNVAADGNGQLWGIGQKIDVDTDTRLYRIDKSTGAVTEVTTINKNLYTGSTSSLAFDLSDGKLYLAGATYVDDALQQRTYEYAIYEVNTSTGVCTPAVTFPVNTRFSSLFFKDSHPKAPKKVSNLQFNFDSGSITDGYVTFTFPTATYDGSSLTGQLKADIIVDGTTTTVTGMQPGQTYTGSSSTLSSGSTHTVKVICYKDELQSLPATTEVYAGQDTPAPVSNVKVEYSNPYDRATISWDAPTVGASGGYIDVNRMTFTVTRKPDNVVVAKDIIATSCVDVLDREMSITQYQVTAEIRGAVSTPVYSDAILVGKAYTTPYLQTFDTNTDFLTYTVIDANGDANNEDGGTWYWDYNTRTAMFYTNLKAADDWLITPTIEFDHDKIYRIQFQTNGYMSSGNNHFQVTLGNDCTAAAQSTVIMDEEYPSSKSLLTFYTMFRPATSDNRMGFHVISDGSDHMYLDNISITEYGPVTIPAKVTDIELTKTDDGKVKAVFTNPTKDMAGNDLASLVGVAIYRAGLSTPLASLSGVTPGQRVEWIDEEPVAGYNHYIFVAFNASGAGDENDAAISTYADVPKAVSNIKVVGKNAYTIADITWEQDLVGVNGKDIRPSDISYDVTRQIGVYKTLIAEGVSGTNYIDRGLVDALGDRQQQYVSYIITPHTNGGTGASATSAEILLGKSYSLPYNETFAEQAYQTCTWVEMNGTGGGFWGIVNTGYNPSAQGQDGAGLLTFSTSAVNPSGQADYVSPRIDMSTFANVEATFYVYRSNDTNTTGATLQAGIYSEETGMVMLSDVINVYNSEAGWYKVTMPIPAKYSTCDHLSLAFRGRTNNVKGSVHLDNISVTGESTEYEVKAEQILGPEQTVMGKDNVYYVEVKNLGTKDNSNIIVEFYAGNELIGSQNIESLPAGKATQVCFTYSPSIDNEERAVTLRAVVSARDDESQANNIVETVIDLVAPMLPMVNDLAGSLVNEKPYLSWTENNVYPHIEYCTDYLESYPAFAIDGLEGWKMIDVDGAKTVLTSLDGTSTLQWDNCGEPQAFIVFNADYLGTSASIFAPRSGNQCFISWEATTAAGASVDGNDDWLISPLLSGDEQEISFYARCFYPYALEEQFEIWVSSTNNDDTSSFTQLSRTTTVDKQEQWTKYTFTLPAGTRYFAIRCVSKHQYGLMIDDITYSPAHEALEFWGYNVYRDSQLVTLEPIGETEFIDQEVVLPETGDMRYNVTALYDKGESMFSNDVFINKRESGLQTIGAGNALITPVNGGVKVVAPRGQIIRVVTAAGSLRHAVRSTGTDLLPLAPGTYVVTVGTTTAKLLVK